MPKPTNAVRLILIAGAMVFSASARDAVPPVYFHHTTISVTSDTYEAFKASPLLQEEFSGSERTTHADGGARVSTGFYLPGMHTHLELFKAGPSAPPSVGTIGVGMWIDHRTRLSILSDRLGLPEIRTRLDAQGQPWYDFLRAGSKPPEGVGTWILANYPDGTTRDRGFLGTDYRPGGLFRDVVAYTVTVSAEERIELLRWFRAYGYSIREDGEKRIATGPEFTLTMLPEPASGPRTAVIKMTLNREKTGEQTYKIGDSERKFNKDRATLTFRFPQPDRH
jgi:hypothetical protein